MSPPGKIYNFSLPTRLIIGAGSIGLTAEEARSFGERVLLVSGRSAMRRLGILDSLVRMLNSAGLRVTLFAQVEPEPSTETVNTGVELARQEGCTVVLGLGGGSVLDVAKAIAGIANKEGRVEEFQEGRRLDSPGLPFIAIPTTAGSGAEVTPNAVLINKEKGIKRSFRHPFLAAKVAIVDPELTLNLPAHLTAYSGMDALSQAMETFVSLGANPVTDSLCCGALRLIGRSLLKAYKEGRDLSARIDMTYGSLMAGMALFNARMGLVHGIAHPLGVKYGLAHGLVCGLLLPYVMEFNLEVAREKYAQIAPLLGGRRARAEVAISRIRDFLRALDFPKGLRELGVKEEDFSALAKESMPSGSLKANPKKVSEADVMEILKKAL